MNLTQKQLTYDLEMVQTENIKILINGNEVFNETVSMDKVGNISFSFREYVKATQI